MLCICCVLFEIIFMCFFYAQSSETNEMSWHYSCDLLDFMSSTAHYSLIAVRVLFLFLVYFFSTFQSKDFLVYQCLSMKSIHSKLLKSIEIRSIYRIVDIWQCASTKFCYSSYIIHSICIHEIRINVYSTQLY